MFKKTQINKSSDGLTLISKGSRLEGDLELVGDCLVAGSIKGRINTSNNLTISEDGFFDGDLKAKEVTIAGRMNGSLLCDKVVITGSGRVDGEIRSDLIEIHAGGQFEGLRKSHKQVVDLKEHEKDKLKEKTLLMQTSKKQN